MVNISQIANRFRTPWRCIVIFFIYASLTVKLFGQMKPLNIVQSHEDDQKIVLSQYPMQMDSMRIKPHLDSLVNDWKNQGYLNATLDSFEINIEAAKAIIYRGFKYDQFNLIMDAKTTNLLQEAGLSRVKWIKSTYKHTQVLKAMDKILVYLENNGYPFATVKLDSVNIDQGQISSKLTVDKKKYIVYDTLNVKGDVNMSNSFLEKYLDIKPNEAYNLSRILAIKKRITSLPYVRLKSDPNVSFINSKAVINLELERQQASTFDFIIGILPNNQNGQRDFIITGEFTGDLFNELGYGERIYAKFERLKPETQELELKYNMPYLFNWPFGIDTEFGLYKNSSNFLDLQSKFGLQYIFSGINYLDASWYFNSSRLIEVDTTNLLSSKRLPSQLDVNYSGGGVGISIQDVDYRYNPSRGWTGSFRSIVGIKTIVPNATIQGISEGEFSYETAYDTLDSKSFQAELHLNAAYYLPIGNWATLKAGVNSAYKHNQVEVYDNELYRIGGNKLMRGFDEQSILTNLYAVATAEFRIVLDRNSFLSFPFIDYGRINVLVNDELTWQNAFGTGIGLNFATGAGIFNVSFAIGKKTDIPIDFNATKIHFGYVSLF